MAENTEIRVAAHDRRRHIYVPGMTQHGKSTLIENQILDDIKFGRGVCLMDAKSQSARTVAQWIPEHRAGHTLYLSEDDPIPIDLLSYKGEHEKRQILAEIEYLFARNVDLANAPNIASNVQMIAQTILSYNENPAFKHGTYDINRKATFFDIWYFIADENRRKEILAGTVAPDLRHYWTQPKTLPEGEHRVRIRTRMTKFVFSPYFQKLLDAPNPTFNMADAIRNRNIILVTLAGC